MSRLPLALAGLLLAAAPAAADVTPRQVWDEWLASLQANDAEVTTGAVEEGGDRIVVTDLSIATKSDGNDAYSLGIGELVLTGSSDGTVGVTVSPEYSVVLTGTDPDGVEREMHLLVQHPDMEMTVAEEGDIRQHSFSAPEIRATIEQALADGEPVDAAGNVVFEDARGFYGVGGGEAGASSFAAARISVQMTGSDEETGEKYAVDVGVQGFESSDLLQIVGKDTAELARQLAPGASHRGTFSTEAATFSLEGGADTSNVSGTMGPGGGTIGLSPAGLDYSSEAHDLTLAFSGDALPLPQVNVEFGKASLALRMPLLANEEPQPFAVGLSLVEVALDPGLWNMVDPAGILPRDPGEITIDLSGDVTVEQDVDARDVATDEPGGELRTLAINTARVAFADTEIAASGDLTMAPSPAGEPQMVGEIDVALTGATQLLDKLVQVGLVPEEQAMGARMMLGMFARPGATAQDLVSKIRLSEDGGVYVNEQRVR